MPRKPTIHIQKIAPGPPSEIAKCHATNIAKTHGARKGGGQSLEMINCARVVGIVVHAAHDLWAVG